MIDIFTAFALVFIAEMGDKTQLMAMAFATRFKVKHIITGIAVGCVLNHGLAIILGTLLNGIVDIDIIQFLVGILFVAFGILSFKIDQEEIEKEKKSHHGIIITVALTFFLAELGDKSQLTAMALALETGKPFLTLIGTTTGMLMVSLLGIYVGIKMGEKIPETTIKLISGSIFVFVGVVKICTGSYVYGFGTNFVLVLAAIIGLITLMKLNLFKRELDEIEISAIKSNAIELYEFYRKVKIKTEMVCKNCDDCNGNICAIGYVKEILINDRNAPINFKRINEIYTEGFDIKKVNELKTCIEEQDRKILDKNENSRLDSTLDILNRIIDRDSYNDENFNINEKVVK